jgi:hypothetical protein
MLDIDPDQLEATLAEEVGQHRATELISRLEAAGAIRSAKSAALITAEQAAEWAGRALTDGDIGWLRREIPKTSIPDAINTMAISLAVPEDDTGRRAGQNDDRLPSGATRDLDWYPYFPAVLQELYDAAGDREVTVLDDVSVRAGLIWVCDACGWRNPHWFDSCAIAH